MVRTKRRNKNRYSRRRVSRRRVSGHRVSKKNNKRSRKIHKRKMMRGGSGDVKLPNYIPHEDLVPKEPLAHLSLILVKGIYPDYSPGSPLNNLPEEILINISKHLAGMFQPYKVDNRVIIKNQEAAFLGIHLVDNRPGILYDRPITNVLITELPNKEGKFEGVIFTGHDTGYRNFKFRLKDILGKIKGFAPGEECMVKINGEPFYGIIKEAPGFRDAEPWERQSRIRQPENGKYHVYIPGLKTSRPDVFDQFIRQNRGSPARATFPDLYNNIHEEDIDHLQSHHWILETNPASQGLTSGFTKL